MTPKSQFFGRLTKTLIILIILLTACNSSPKFEDAYTVITDGKLRPGDSIPLPTGEVILTVGGKIGAPNSGQEILMDRETIESVGLVEYTVNDPFQQRPITYRGVLLRDLLDLWQVPDDATVLDTLALNDYRVEVPIEPLRETPVIYALQADGEYMPVSELGPAMFVFPYHQFEFERPLTESYWVWQIKSIEVK